MILNKNFQNHSNTAFQQNSAAYPNYKEHRLMSFRFKLILLLNYLNFYLLFISDAIFWFTSCFFIQVWTRHSIIGRLQEHKTSSDLGPRFSANPSAETPGRPLGNLAVQGCFCNTHSREITSHRVVLQSSTQLEKH